MQEIWHRIESWLAANAPNVLNNLQIGTSESQIQQIEELVDIKLPEDVKQIYRLHNGQIVGTPGLLYGNEFLPLEKVIDDWRFWIEINEEFAPEEVHWNPKWVPLAHNGGGDYFCVDLDPEIGDTGRIIWAGHEYIPEIDVVASSFRFWLEKFADDLYAGVYEYYEGIHQRGLFTEEDLIWIRRDEESFEKGRKTQHILSHLFEALPLEEQQEYRSRGALDLPHAEAVIDRLPSNKQQAYLEQGVSNSEEAHFVLQQLHWHSTESLGLQLGSDSVLDD